MGSHFAFKQRLETSRKLTIKLTSLSLDFRLGAVARENFQQDIFPNLLHRYMHWTSLWILKLLFQEIMPIQIVKTGRQIQPNLQSALQIVKEYLNNTANTKWVTDGQNVLWLKWIASVVFESCSC